jgi:hypothetical protein
MVPALADIKKNFETCKKDNLVTEDTYTLRGKVAS